MNKFDKKRSEKTYKKIDSIAKKGKDGWIEYNDYIDQLINDGEYYILEYVLERYYKIDSYKYTPVDIKSNRIYDLIRFQTTSKFQENLKKLYDQNNIYSIGVNVYQIGLTYSIGKISEQTNEKDQNIIVVVKDNSVLTIDDTNISLLDKYKTAVNFLLN